MNCVIIDTDGIAPGVTFTVDTLSEAFSEAGVHGYEVIGWAESPEGADPVTFLIVPARGQ